MRAIIFGTAMVISLGGCASRPEAPVAPVAPRAPQFAPAPPAPPPPPQDWRDIALSPGDWSYRSETSGSVASFGTVAPAFALRCVAAARQLTIERSGVAAGSPLVVRTSFGERNVVAGAPLAASDPLLDQIAFSRGRFTVTGGGLPTLVIPSWPEPARTIEDCRG